jgi:hypothetical protein
MWLFQANGLKANGFKDEPGPWDSVRRKELTYKRLKGEKL